MVIFIKIKSKKTVPRLNHRGLNYVIYWKLKAVYSTTDPTGRKTVCTTSNKQTPKNVKTTRMFRGCNFFSVLRSSCFFPDTNFHRRQSLTSLHTFVMPARYIRHINLENGLLSVSLSEVQWMNFPHGDRGVYRFEFCRGLKIFFFALRSPLLNLSLPELVRFSCLNNYGN